MLRRRGRRPTERTAGVGGQAADGQWWPASVVVAIRTPLNVVSVSFVRQLSAVSQCGEQHSRLTHGLRQPHHCTPHTVWTPSSASLQDSQHCRSLLNNVWPEKCPEIASTIWTQRRSRDPQSHASKQVKPGRKLGRRPANAAQPRCAAHAYTGTNSDWHEYILCKYINQRPHRILW